MVITIQFNKNMYIRLLLVAIALLATFSFVVIHKGFSRKISIQDVQHFCQLKFPPSADGMKYTFYGGHESWMYVRFSMSPKELTNFWKDTPCRTAESQTEGERQRLRDLGMESRRDQDILLFPPPPRDKVEWWQPENANKFEIRAFPPPVIDISNQPGYKVSHKKIVQKIIIDKTNEKQYTVYIFSGYGYNRSPYTK